jgi:hypothetical protein
MVGWLKDFIADFIIAALVAATILVSAITWLPSLYEPEGQTNPQQSGQSSNSWEGLVSWERLIVLSNFGLLLVTAALAVATISLARSTKVAADAARDAADAARDAADIAQVQLYPVLWPRIVGSVIGVGPERDSDGKLQTKSIERSPRITLEFENLGGSDAILESVQFAFRLADEAPREASVKTALPANRVVQRGSKSKSFDSEPMTLSGEEMSAVLNQDTFLWLYGVVAFADVRGTQWETEFCFRYDGDSLGPYPPDRNKCRPLGR